jgi:hypothetical protein
MNSSFSLSLLFAVPVLIGIMALLAASIYALVMRSKSRRASNFLLLGIFFKIAAYILNLVSNVIMSGTFATSELPFYIGLGNIITACINLLGLALIVVAVFVDRGGSSQNDDRARNSGEPIDNDLLRNPEEDSNPFRTPIAN